MGDVMCPDCSGEGEISICIDDLCHGDGGCIHGDGNIACATCAGEGFLVNDGSEDEP